jgi:hypothetical protein
MLVWIGAEEFGTIILIGFGHQLWDLKMDNELVSTWEEVFRIIILAMQLKKLSFIKGNLEN